MPIIGLKNAVWSNLKMACVRAHTHTHMHTHTHTKKFDRRLRQKLTERVQLTRGKMGKLIF